ncbi:hypothetical protein FRB99_005184, partial [Tulasnella sp. 403]
MNMGISAFKMKLWCILENSAGPFPVTMDEADTVYDVKKAIKKELRHKLDKVPAPYLTLWKISKSSKEALKLTRADLEGEKPLDPMDTVRECWTDPLPAKVVHVFIAVSL